MPIDDATYREILTNFPSGVAIVTAHDENDQPFGLTVSAFCAVSLKPPLVLVCIDKTSNTLAAIRRSGGFTVNLLAAGREDLARLYASKTAHKFDDVEWDTASVAEAGPVLSKDIVGHVACLVHSAIEAGDHWIYVGRVEGGETRPGEMPLVYGRRTFADWDDVTR